MECITTEKQYSLVEIADKLEDYYVDFCRKKWITTDRPEHYVYDVVFKLIIQLRTAFVKVKTLEGFFNGDWEGLTNIEMKERLESAISAHRDEEHEKTCSSLCIKPESECEHKHHRYYCKSHVSCEREKEVTNE